MGFFRRVDKKMKHLEFYKKNPLSWEMLWFVALFSVSIMLAMQAKDFQDNVGTFNKQCSERCNVVVKKALDKYCPELLDVSLVMNKYDEVFWQEFFNNSRVSNGTIS